MIRVLVGFLSMLLVLPVWTGCADRNANTRMVGMYAYFADAGSFTACGSDTRLPVAMETDNAALERAYSASPHEPGEAMLITFQGRVEPRPPMEGRDPVDHVIVERFHRVWPGESCARFRAVYP